jgi:hypothetical protein
MVTPVLPNTGWVFLGPGARGWHTPGWRWHDRPNVTFDAWLSPTRFYGVFRDPDDPAHEEHVGGTWRRCDDGTIVCDGGRRHGTITLAYDPTATGWRVIGARGRAARIDWSRFTIPATILDAAGQWVR